MPVYRPIIYGWKFLQAVHNMKEMYVIDSLSLLGSGDDGADFSFVLGSETEMILHHIGLQR